jgi:class 3 adenylate cyclase
MSAPQPTDVEGWLAELGLSVYAPAFKANDIDATVLASLTSEDLREIGVTSVGHRRRILEAAARLAPRGGDLPAATDPALPPAPASSAPPAPTAERRQITVMFCDLMDSTALSVRVDPEDYREFIARYRAVLEEALTPHNGYIAQYLGDGVLVYFGYPVSHEDDAENAVEAALAVVEKVGEMELFDGRRPGVRVGIATGVTVVGAADRTRELQGESAVGETPNLAARLQALATANTVVVAPSTRELVGDQFECNDLGLFELKGFDRPVRAWQVLRRSRADRFEARRMGRRSNELIGREAELTRLRQRLATARTGRGQVAVISGEGGLGKSRLARQILEEAGMRQGVPPVLQCTGYNVGSPFHPIRYYIERASELDPRDPPDVAAQKLSALLARADQATPENLALLAELTRLKGIDLAPLDGLASAERRSRTMRLLQAGMEAVLRESAVVVIEDIQWIDPSTAELIEKLSPAIRSLPVLLIATMRPGTFPSWLAASEARLIQLERLPHDDICALVRSVAAPAQLPDHVVQTIATRSDGIPVFAEELTRGTVAGPGGQQAGGEDASSIPVTLADSLLARLDRLKQGRRIASIAAVIGREFPISILVAVSGLPEAEVRTGVGELLDADVLAAGHSPFGEAVAFRHLLLRDAAYQLLLRRDRALLHARIAEALVTTFPAIGEALPHVVAIQWNEAGDFARAAAAWDRAGEQAAGRSAYSEAIDHFTKAIAANTRCEEGAERDEREFTYRMKLSAALIAAHGFSAEGVAQEMEKAAALSLKLGSAARLVPALTGRWVVAGGSGDFRLLLDLALQVSRAAENGSAVDRLLAHRVLGTSLLFTGQFRPAFRELEQFVGLYDRERDDRELSKIGPSNHALMTMVGLAEIHTLFEEFEAADRWMLRVLQVAREGGQAHNLCNALMFCGCFLPALRREEGDIAACAAELKAISLQQKLPYWLGHAELFGGLALIRHGSIDEGFIEARRGMKQIIASNAFMNGPYILYAEACLEAGRTDEGRQSLEHAKLSIEGGQTWLEAEYHRVRARLDWMEDGASAARKSFETALRIAETQGARLFAARAAKGLADLQEAASGGVLLKQEPRKYLH